MFYIIKLLLDNSNSDRPNLEVSLSESMKNFLYFVLRYSFCGCCGSPGYSQTGYVTEYEPWITEPPASFTQELESPACGTTIQFILFYKKKEITSQNQLLSWFHTERPVIMIKHLSQCSTEAPRQSQMREWSRFQTHVY